MSDNQQRAAELCIAVRAWQYEGATSDGLALLRDHIAAALDAAEARGRAERNTVWKAKVEALAAEVQSGVPGLARRLRALVAELVPGAQTDGEAGR